MSGAQEQGHCTLPEPAGNSLCVSACSLHWSFSHCHPQSLACSTDTTTIHHTAVTLSGTHTLGTDWVTRDTTLHSPGGTVSSRCPRMVVTSRLPPSSASYSGTTRGEKRSHPRRNMSWDKLYTWHGKERGAHASECIKEKGAAAASLYRLQNGGGGCHHLSQASSHATMNKQHVGPHSTRPPSPAASQTGPQGSRRSALHHPYPAAGAPGHHRPLAAP